MTFYLGVSLLSFLLLCIQGHVQHPHHGVAAARNISTKSTSSTSPQHFYDPVMDFLDQGEIQAKEEARDTSRETAAFYAMMASKIKTEKKDFQQTTLYEKVIEVMQYLDRDGNGEIDEDEYVAAAVKNPEILDVFRYVLFGEENEGKTIVAPAPRHQRRRSGLLAAGTRRMSGRMSLSRGNSFHMGSGGGGSSSLVRRSSFHMKKASSFNEKRASSSSIGVSGSKEKDYCAMTKLNQVLNFQMEKEGRRYSFGARRPSSSSTASQDSDDLASSIAKFHAEKRRSSGAAMNAARLKAELAKKEKEGSANDATRPSSMGRRATRKSKSSFDVGTLIETVIVESDSDSDSSSSSSSVSDTSGN
jgi:hypothetical protein